jgi:hypothetical protein
MSGDYENSWEIDGVFQGTLERGMFIDIPLTRTMRITSAASILVAQYDHSSGEVAAGDFRLGDPCMMIVPAVDNYDTLYTFQSIPHPEFLRHFISIVAPSIAIPSLRLDGNPVTTPFLPIAGTPYSYAQVEVESGAHLIRGDSAFGVQVYGYGQATSYAYTGGFVFRRLVTAVEVVDTPAPDPLSEIYPNPTSGLSARLSLQLQRTTPITIEITNSQGDIVMRPLRSEPYLAGPHDLIIDISPLSSGTYQIRVVAGDQVDTRMLVVAR